MSIANVENWEYEVKKLWFRGALNFNVRNCVIWLRGSINFLSKGKNSCECKGI